MSTDRRFAGQRALVTGAGGGIGRTLVAMLRAEGAVVTGADRVGVKVDVDHAVPGDLTDPAYCDALCAEASVRMGGLDLVFNNAGIITRGKITETSDEDYRLTMAINVEAPFRICRAAVPILVRGGGGAIVNISSCWGLHPGPNHPLYVMSKAALASLTQCLGRDHARDGVRVNAVCPNEVDTAMLRTGFAVRGLDPGRAIDDLNDSVPLGRIAHPRDIADVALFLASDAARYMCGALVEVNGGKPVT